MDQVVGSLKVDIDIQDLSGTQTLPHRASGMGIIRQSHLKSRLEIWRTKP